jgi:hypothetical protein
MVIFTSGCTNNGVNNQILPQSNSVNITSTPTGTPTYIPTMNIPTFVVTSTPESQRDQNIATIKNIIEVYHQTHTYNLPDMYACAQMSQDVWDQVETRNINAIIEIGSIDQNISSEQQSDHAWVLAEVSPGEYIAMETTGGYLACSDSRICPVNNPLYFKGWSFNTPKELQDYMNNPSGCSAGSLPGSDNLCHPACGATTYCTGNSICVDGQCRGCGTGYVLGQDLQCHQSCGGGNNYCTGSSVCVNGQCRDCDTGYILGQDVQCHPICGNGYCLTGSCVNGQCIRVSLQN